MLQQYILPTIPLSILVLTTRWQKLILNFSDDFGYLSIAGLSKDPLQRGYFYKFRLRIEMLDPTLGKS